MQTRVFWRMLSVMRRLALPGSLLAVVFGGGVARAIPPPTPAEIPPPSVRLTITAISPTSSWRMRVENTGDLPVRLTADARLLAFDLTPAAPTATAHGAPASGGRRAPRVLRCALPDDMRPTNDVDRALVLPPKRAYAETFDPRLYCFEAAEQAALAPGATMVARLGWREPAHTRGQASPPFAVSPIAGVLPLVKAEKELISAPFVVPAEPAQSAGNPPLVSVGPEAPPEPFPTKLALAVPAHIDAWSSLDLSIPITVSNHGQRSVTFLFRPETVGFDVIGPEGVARCEWPRYPPAPVREAYTTLAPRAHQSIAVILGAYCPDNTFDQPGLFVVRPHLDTRKAGGEPIGLRTFDGEVIGTTTTVLRLHHGKRPPLWHRPKLEPQ